jgi:hypothetical protein
MKCSTSLRSLLLVSLPVTLCFLSGCGDSFNVPDTGTASEGAGIQGSVYGGHAPLVGAHVYLLQVGSGTAGEGMASATPLLGTGSTSSPGGYPLQSNVSDPNIPLGWEYVTTDSNGDFSLTNAYTCTKNDPVYIYAWGGTPGGAGSNNPAVVNLATLGDCPLTGTFKGTILYVYMNEVSTVATAYAFQGFTSATKNDAVHISYDTATSSAEGLTGIENAANNTLQLYDITGSVAGHVANYKTYGAISPNIGPNGGSGVVPQTVLNTLANILAACVDSGNSLSSPQAACTSLFATATSNGAAGGTQPTDTATAAINIARHPAGVGNTSFASTLFGIPTGAVPFSPNLNNSPPDFSVAIQYPGTANSVFDGSRSIALDANGNFWFTTWVTPPVPGTDTYGTGYLAEGNSLGTIQTSHLNSTYAMGNIAIDSNNNAWAGTYNVSLGPIYEEGPSTSGFTTYSPGFTAAASPVADNSTSSGDLYFTHGPTCTLPPSSCSSSGTQDDNPTLTEVNASGSTVGSGNVFTFPSAAFPTHAAIDSAGYEWITSDTATYGNVITRVAKGTAAVPSSSGFPVYDTALGACGSFVGPEQLAIDSSGNAWIPVYGVNAQGTGVYVVNSTATGLNACNYYNTESGNSVAPYGAAVDGADNVWITNTTGGTSGVGSLAELSSSTGLNLSSTNFQPINQISGTVSNVLNDPLNVAVDISGDIFITNYSGNSIVEFIGLATPLYGPLGVAAGAGKIGTAP